MPKHSGQTPKAHKMRDKKANHLKKNGVCAERVTQTEIGSD